MVGRYNTYRHRLHTIDPYHHFQIKFVIRIACSWQYFLFLEYEFNNELNMQNVTKWHNQASICLSKNCTCTTYKARYAWRGEWNSQNLSQCIYWHASMNIIVTIYHCIYCLTASKWVLRYISQVLQRWCNNCTTSLDYFHDQLCSNVTAFSPLCSLSQSRGCHAIQWLRN